MQSKAIYHTAAAPESAREETPEWRKRLITRCRFGF